MTRNAIPKNATITVIRGRLSDPDKYLSGVLNNMMLCKKEHGSAAVRIGTTGEGRHPHYRVEPEAGEFDAITDLITQMPSLTAEEQARQEAHIAITYYKAYRGDNHEQFNWGKDELQYESWSTHSMNVEQVRKLIGDVRADKKAKPQNRSG